MAFSPDGRTLATAGMEGKLKLWNVATRQEMVTIGLRGGFATVRFSPDGRFLALGSKVQGTGTIELLRAPVFDEIATADRASR